MKNFDKVVSKLEAIGFGVERKGNKITVYESWCEDCLLILGVKTYKDGLKMRNKELEKRFYIKLVSSAMGRDKVSRSVFRLTKIS